MGDPKKEGEGLPSINEPPAPEGAGGAAPAAAPEAAPAYPPLPSDSELMAMTRAQLDTLAETEYDFDSTGLSTKADVIAALHEQAEA